MPWPAGTPRTKASLLAACVDDASAKLGHVRPTNMVDTEDEESESDNEDGAEEEQQKGSTSEGNAATTGMATTLGDATVGDDEYGPSRLPVPRPALRLHPCAWSVAAPFAATGPSRGTKWGRGRCVRAKICPASPRPTIVVAPGRPEPSAQMADGLRSGIPRCPREAPTGLRSKKRGYSRSRGLCSGIASPVHFPRRSLRRAGPRLISTGVR